MRIHSMLQRLRRPALAVAAVALWTGAVAQDKAVEAVEIQELRVALRMAQDQHEAEKGRADTLESQRQALVESLAEAVRVSEEQTAAARETELKLQALGVDLLNRDENSLEQRLLKAVRDLDISQQEKERQSVALRRIAETCLKLLEGAPGIDAKTRAEAEASLAAANQALAPADQPTDGPVDLSKSRVVSIDEGIGLVVFDAGRKSGLRVGTPVAVLRGERALFSALVVDVRDSISGAVLQDRLAESGEVEVGDGLRLLPEQNPL